MMETSCAHLIMMTLRMETFSFDGKDGMIEFANRNSTSIRNYVSSDRDSFVQLRSLE